MIPTPPEPFAALPMSWRRAFGGQAKVDEGQVPCAENPLGRGFQLLPVPGTPLPNLEDPERPVRHWRDWPTPVCFAPCPRQSKLRADRGVVVDGETHAWQIRPAYFSCAHPWLTFVALAPETPIEVEGMTPGRPFHCGLPMPPLEVEVTLGARRVKVPTRLDTVELRPEKVRVSVVLRAPFRYLVNPGEARSAIVTTAGSRA